MCFFVIHCITFEYVVGWCTPRPVAEHSRVWWCMGTMAVLSTELPCLDSCRGEGIPITIELPPEDPLEVPMGGPRRPPGIGPPLAPAAAPPELGLSPSWFITVMWGPKGVTPPLLLSLCESKLVCTSMECWWIAAPPEALELSRLKHGVDDTEDPDRCKIRSNFDLIGSNFTF